MTENVHPGYEVPHMFLLVPQFALAKRQKIAVEAQINDAHVSLPVTSSSLAIVQ
jgi:ppGpp synthetase/RelA/SpoT-type nucleotidyltranferase